MSCKEVGVAREKQKHMSCLLPWKNKKTSKQASSQTIVGKVRIHKQKKRIWEMGIASQNNTARTLHANSHLYALTQHVNYLITSLIMSLIMSLITSNHTAHSWLKEHLSPAAVLSMWPCTVKLDERKVKKICPYGSGKWFWLIIIVQRAPVKKRV
jgi:hypothetical protein